MILFHLCVLLFAALCSADRKDMDIQTIFKNMEGELANTRDACFKELSFTIDDMHDYEQAEDIPEAELCFFKCFYEKTFVLDANGNVLIDILQELPEVKSLEDAKREDFIKCINDADTIKTCKDVTKLEKCYDGLF